MGRMKNGLHKASSTLSWVRSQLPKSPQLYSDRFAHPHELDPLVHPDWEQAPGASITVSATFGHSGGQAGSSNASFFRWLGILSGK